MTRATVPQLALVLALACAAARPPAGDPDGGAPAPAADGGARAPADGGSGFATPADAGFTTLADGGAPAPAAVHTVEGRVAALDRNARSLAVDGPAGAVTLELDRNTSVYLPDRLGTIADLAVGARVRAAYGAERRAYWVEVERRAP